jgi:phage/plasmid-like protein (TIGR03299 family)
MSHELEIINGKAMMAYAGEAPWHKLGTKVPNDLTPAQMGKAAGVDWKVEMRDTTVPLNKKSTKTGAGVLIRLANGRNIEEESILTKVPDINGWYPTQNDEALEFFHEFVMKGKMDMECVGSLFDGQIIWALAKVKDSFTINGRKDRVDSYLLFSNPHKYGMSRNIRFTPIRVVCNNTLTWSLEEKSKNAVSSNHRRKFNADEVKEKLGLAHTKMEGYKERAEFLSSKKYNKTNIVEYFKELFPMGEKKKEAKRERKTELHIGARTCLALLDTQPGADFAPGTWWNAFNAATFYVDHVYGKNETTRLQNSWFGGGENKKNDALTKALEYAS